MAPTALACPPDSPWKIRNTNIEREKKNRSNMVTYAFYRHCRTMNRSLRQYVHVDDRSMEKGYPQHLHSLLRGLSERG